MVETTAPVVLLVIPAAVVPMLLPLILLVPDNTVAAEIRIPWKLQASVVPVMVIPAMLLLVTLIEVPDWLVPFAIRIPYTFPPPTVEDAVIAPGTVVLPIVLPVIFTCPACTSIPPNTLSAVFAFDTLKLVITLLEMVLVALDPANK